MSTTNTQAQGDSAHGTATADVAAVVREKYAESARRVAEAGGCGGGPGCCRTESLDPVTSNLYDADDVADLPHAAVAVSLGCGNPTALAQLHPGETVLDLGSGGGIDVLLSARRVGPEGTAYGLDMTDEMLDLARENQRKAAVYNAEFLRGEIENIPLPDASVDVIISNCVINLSGDKPRVLREAARVLRPGGRFAVSDVIADPDMDDATRADMAQWTGCIAGALTHEQFVEVLADAGLADVEIRETHRVHEHAAAAIIRARKPAAEPGCCSPAQLDTCCEPAAKNDCCGETSAAAPATCGCAPTPAA